MCPKMIDGICALGDIEPEHIGCASSKQCQGKNWSDCSVYVSQFFFDSSDKFIG